MTVFITLMMLFFSVRMYTKLFIQKKVSWDDCMYTYRVAGIRWGLG